MEQSSITLKAKSGTVQIQLAEDYTTKNDSGKILVDRLFLIGLINASDISIEHLNFDGNNQSGVRTIGACPETDRSITDIRLRYIHSQGFTSYFSIWGRSIADKRLKKGAWSNSHSGRKMAELLDERPGFICAGSIRDVILEDSTLLLQQVGFYLVPYANWLTRNIQVAPSKWREHADSVSHRNGNITIRNNVFKADHDLAKYSKRDFARGMKLTNGMKLHYAENVLVEDNRFDAGNFPRAFRRGAAVNLAPGMKGVTIKGNEFILPQKADDPYRAISLKLGFTPHGTFGLGKDAVTVPVRNVSIHDNQFEYSGIKLANCCRDGTSRFCEFLHNGMEFNVDIKSNRGTFPPRGLIRPFRQYRSFRNNPDRFTCAEPKTFINN